MIYEIWGMMIEEVISVLFRLFRPLRQVEEVCRFLKPDVSMV